MSCERYKKEIVDAATSGLAAGNDLMGVSGNLREHLDSCADCRALLASEQALFAAIDITVRSRANAEAGPNFLSQVRAAVARQAPAKHGLLSVWAYGLTAAVLVLAVVLARGWQKSGNGSSQQNVGDIATITKHAEAVPTFRASNQAHSMPAEKHIVRKPSESVELSILVQAGQEELLVRFYEANRPKPDGTSAAVGEQSGVTTKPLVIAPLEIAELRIQNLDDSGDVSR